MSYQGEIRDGEPTGGSALVSAAQALSRLGVRIRSGALRRLGGPMGRRGGGVSPLWTFLLAALSWITCMVRQLPCRQSLVTDPAPNTFGWMCYNDITVLYYARGQVTGSVPFASTPWEYPVLTGYFATVANWISALFGAVTKPGIDEQQMLDNSHIYFAVTAVGLCACLMWLMASHIKIARYNTALSVAVALSPTIWATGLINWDILAVALTAAGLASWMERKPTWAGLWWGLGVAAKFYPIVVIAAILVCCVRPARVREDEDQPTLGDGLMMALAAGVTWLVVNLPMMMTRMSQWAGFYTANSVRGADLGSIWYALQLMGIGPEHPIWWSRTVLVIGYAGLAFLIYIAPRPMKPVQVAYLAVAILLAANVVYSPQYVLWVLPLVVLACPKARDLAIFTCSELLYFICVWLFLGGKDLSLGLSQAPWMYIFSILIRIGATVWVMSRVVRGALVPADPADVLGGTMPRFDLRRSALSSLAGTPSVAGSVPVAAR